MLFHAAEQYNLANNIVHSGACGPVNLAQLLYHPPIVHSYRMANGKRLYTYTFEFVVFKQLSYLRTHVSHIDLAFQNRF